MKRILPLLFLAIAAPAFAAWTVTSGLNADGTTTDNFYATDGTWDLHFVRSGNGGYYCRNNSGTGGALLDLTTFNDDMAAAGVTWNSSAHYPVTVIGLNNEGFMNLTGLTQVKLPATVQRFSNQCFRGTGLAGEFIFPDSITSMGDNVFSNCKSLTRVVVNENLTTLQNTFYGCSSLVEVKIASGTTTLSGSPFRGCSALTTVYANEEDRLVGSVVLPTTVTKFDSYVFCDDTSIERIVAPGVTTIGERAFQNCTSLTDVVLPALQQFSSTYTFNGCPLLQRVELPNCTKLGQATFQGCTALEEVLVSPSLHTLGNDCFRGDTSFKTLYTNEATKVVGHVQLPATCTSGIGGFTFYQTQIERIDAPSVPSISGERAFENCKLLEEAYFPSLASMACSYAFSGCPLLRIVEVSPDLAGTINDCAFNSCYSLETVFQSGNAPVVGLVDLPAGVTKLGWGAFLNGRAIEHVVAPGVVTIENRAFKSCTILKTARFSPDLAELKNNGGSSSDCAINECPALVDFYPSTMPKATKLYAGTFVNDSSLTNAFDFSGATLSDTSGSFLFSGCKKVPCVRLPQSFSKLYDREFYNMKPGAEIHFAGNIPPFNNNYPLWQGSNGAGNRYKIFVDAETYPAWTNGTNGAKFTAKTAEMESESDYPGIATLGYLNYASNGQNNWLVQEPFYVDVTFYDDDGTTVLGVEKTQLNTAPVWTGATPTKPSTAQYDYTFVGWSTNGTAVVDLATLVVSAPMSFHAVYASSTRAYNITWQWFDGGQDQSETTVVEYGNRPEHAAVERAATETHTYTFLGWSTDGSTILNPLPVVEGPVTYGAVFEEKDAAATVTVRWFQDDHTTLLGTTWPDRNSAAVAPLMPQKESSIDTDYAFAGWSTDGVTVLADLTVAADTDFFAVYETSVRKYTVAFVNWDESPILAQPYEYGTLAADIVRPATTPTRTADEGYTYAFTGWSPTIVDVSGDVTYTATYTATPKTYAATFVDWDGAVLSGPTDYAVGAAVEAPADPERKGYTFTGWTPAVSTMSAADTTYTATYTVNKYTIKFVNGDGVSTAKYDYGTPASSISFPGGSKTSTSKFYYRFIQWEPEAEPVQSNTTYTARFSALVAKPMTLAFSDAVFDTGSGKIRIFATLAGATATGASVVPALAAARFSASGTVGETFNGTAELDGNVYAAELDDLAIRMGYNWTATAEQDWPEYGTKDVAVLRGRSYARRRATWFDKMDVSWNDGVFKPAKTPPDRQQIRVRATFAVPAVPPATLPDATGQIVGIGVKSYGGAPAWHGWTGSAWVRLVGADPMGGGTVEILTVVDFASKSPTATWYANGLPLTTEEGEWAVPLAGGIRLESFEAVGNLEAFSLSGDYDIGGEGFRLRVR